MNQVRARLQVNFDPGQDFSGVKAKSMLVCGPCDFTSGNLNKTSVREKSRAQLLEGRLSLNPGLNLTQVSFSYVQKLFLG